MGSKPTILIVEDDATFRRVLELFLQEKGYVVLTASNSKEALEKLKEKEIHLIILDYKLPGTDGLEFLKTVRKTLSKDLKVIMMTANGTTETFIQAMDCGVMDYFNKPFFLNDLKGAIEQALKEGGEKNGDGNNKESFGISTISIIYGIDIMHK